MNTCRRRKIPNAVARNGADRPMNVLVQPSPSTVWKFTTTVASAGTSSVAMNSRNSTRLPGNSRIANAYAASTDVTTWNTVTITATTSELSEVPPEMARRPRLPEHVEREGGRAGAGCRAPRRRASTRRSPWCRSGTGRSPTRGEQPVAGRRGASRPARRTHERRCAGRGRSTRDGAVERARVPRSSRSIAIVHPPSDAGELEARQCEQQEEQQHRRAGLQADVVADR